MRYTGPKHRLSRRSGVNLLGKQSQSLARRLNIPPGMFGPKETRRKASEYKQQLREKQKVKWAYFLTEAQLRRYVKEATKSRGETARELARLLEQRLDSVVYRLGFAPSLIMARQLVSHGHVLVDGKTVKVPSYQVKVGQVVSLLPVAQKIPVVAKLLGEAPKLAPYLERQAAAGKLARSPEHDEIHLDIAEQLVIGYYSRF